MGRELKQVNLIMWGLFFTDFIIKNVLVVHPAQVSWSDVFCFKFLFFFHLAKLCQCDDFYFLDYLFL